MSDANAALGDNQGTITNNYLIANLNFYSNISTTVTAATQSEFIILANNFVPTNQGTAAGTSFPGSGGTSAATSIQSVEG